MSILSKRPGLAARLLLACSAVATTGLATQVAASSHAEAPYITRQPKVDGTETTAGGSLFDDVPAT